MQQDCTISLERNAMSEGGIRWMYFDAFSSKNRYGTTFTSDYDQGCFIVFECCSSTGKERDEETGYGYFGARYMDYELMTMWLSVDPVADKYPGISPYAYCAWNPVKLIDPDGREIWINGSDGNSYKYRKGKLYTADGKLYTGNDAFAQKACSDITALKKSGLKMRWKISRMERSKKMITINESTSDNNQCSLDDEGQSNRKVGSGSAINYNPNKTSNADGEREPRYGLAHELGHAYDAMRGKMDDSPRKVYKPIGDDFYVQGTIPYSEIRAVEFENIARPSNQQRTTYDGFELNFYLQKIRGSIDKYYGFE